MRPLALLRFAALLITACSPDSRPGHLPDAAPPPDAPEPIGDNDLTRSYDAATVRVDARMNVFAAGLPRSDGAGGGQLPAGLDLAALGNPSQLQLLVVGHKVSCCGVGDNPGADGNTNLQTGIIPTTGNLSGIIHHSRNMFLTGVFVAGPGGDGAPHPSDLEYFEGDHAPTAGALGDHRHPDGDPLGLTSVLHADRSSRRLRVGQHHAGGLGLVRRAGPVQPVRL